MSGWFGTSLATRPRFFFCACRDNAMEIVTTLCGRSGLILADLDPFNDGEDGLANLGNLKKREARRVPPAIREEQETDMKPGSCRDSDQAICVPDTAILRSRIDSL